MNNKKIKIKTDGITINRAKELIQLSSKERYWLKKDLINNDEINEANSAGLTLFTEFPFSITWEGGTDPEDIVLTTEEEYDDMYMLPRINTEIGNGIFTITYPFSLETDNEVALLAVNPINNILPAISVLNSVINQNNNLEINLKMQIADINLSFPKGFAIASIVPVDQKTFNNVELI